jgi:hypothetical protein
VTAPSGWYTDPYGLDPLRWWVLSVRWRKGEVWTPLSAKRTFTWVPPVLTAAAALWVWLFGIPLSQLLAQGVAETPQPNQVTWVLVSEWLPAVPVGGAIVAELIAFAIRRHRGPVAAAAVLAFFVLSLAVAFVAVPKAP